MFIPHLLIIALAPLILTYDTQVAFTPTPRFISLLCLALCLLSISALTPTGHHLHYSTDVHTHCSPLSHPFDLHSRTTSMAPNTFLRCAKQPIQGSTRPTINCPAGCHRTFRSRHGLTQHLNAIHPGFKVQDTTHPSSPSKREAPEVPQPPSSSFHLASPLLASPHGSPPLASPHGSPSLASPSPHGSRSLPSPHGSHPLVSPHVNPIASPVIFPHASPHASPHANSDTDPFSGFPFTSPHTTPHTPSRMSSHTSPSTSPHTSSHTSSSTSSSTSSNVSSGMSSSTSSSASPRASPHTDFMDVDLDEGTCLGPDTVPFASPRASPHTVDDFMDIDLGRGAHLDPASSLHPESTPSPIPSHRDDERPDSNSQSQRKKAPEPQYSHIYHSKLDGTFFLYLHSLITLSQIYL